MKQLHTKKTFFILLLLSVAAFWSCNKNVNDVVNNPQLPDLTTKVTTSVSGFVTNENDAPMNGATVTIGTRTATTNQYGYFEVKNVEVVKTAAVVKVTQMGYFNGIRTFLGVQGKSAFIRIKMIPKTIAGTVNASSGGNVSLSNGMNLSLPSAGVVNAATGAAYSGTVNVAMHWINPAGTDVNQEMPGDLRGLNTGGEMKTLQSYGMTAVELTGASGETLQIATGKKATLSFPIPASLGGTAPASIPLWYFDEAKGLWKEEGTATKSGSNYVGEVSHFSFWNCDVPANYVQFDCTVMNSDLSPMSYVIVKLTDMSNPNNSRIGITDSSGYVAGLVPDNATLKLEVFNYYGCNTAIYTQTFNTNNSAVSLGNVVVPATSLTVAQVSGTVTDCNNNPVTSGSVIVYKDNQYFRYGISNTGTYHFNSLLCNGPESVTLIAEDGASMQQSTPVTATFSNGTVTIPTIQACGTSTSQFFNYTINGISYSFTAPADSFYMYQNPQTTPPQIVLSAEQFTPGQNGYLYLSFGQSGIGVGSTQPVYSFYCNQLVDSAVINGPFNLNITEYGTTGEFISGNFSGSMTGTMNTYAITGNFRVRRYF